ncbi:MAG: hypothetical protein R3B13_14450 [Polyangiaceae bacterium]
MVSSSYAHATRFTLGLLLTAGIAGCGAGPGPRSGPSTSAPGPSLQDGARFGDLLAAVCQNAGPECVIVLGARQPPQGFRPFTVGFRGQGLQGFVGPASKGMTMELMGQVPGTTPALSDWDGALCVRTVAVAASGVAPCQRIAAPRDLDSEGQPVLLMVNAPPAVELAPLLAGTWPGGSVPVVVVAQR